MKQPSECDHSRPGWCDCFQCPVMHYSEKMCRGISGQPRRDEWSRLAGFAERLHGGRPNAPPAEGPGTELTGALAELGIAPGGCACTRHAAQMNVWGVAGCREHRAEIVAWLWGEWQKRGWAETLRAAGLALTKPWFNPLDPAGSAVDEAIRRAAAKAAPPV